MHLKLWSELLQLLEVNLKSEDISLWLLPLKPILLSEEKLVLEAPNGMHRRIVEERYIKTMRRCARALTGRGLEIDFVIDPTNGMRFDRLDSNPPARKRSKRSNTVKLNENYTFEKFVVGRCNKPAYSAATQTVKKPGKKYNPLFITGAAGLGKTHLLQAIGSRAHSVGKDSFLFIPSDRLMDELMEAIKNRTINRARKKFSSVLILLVDDIHFLSGKNQIQEEFFYIFNTLYNRKAQIVLTSDRPPKDIPRLQRRLVARFQSGSVMELKPPGLKTRIAIIESKSRQLGMKLPRKTVMFLASRIRTNIRRMEGALNKIAAYCKISGRSPEHEFVEELLSDRLFETEEDTITISRIQQKVGDHFNIRTSDLLKYTRNSNVVFPRQMAMYLCRKLLNNSHADIGAAFSGRNHTTVIHACKTIQELLRNSSEAREALDDLVTAIRS